MKKKRDPSLFVPTRLDHGFAYAGKTHPLYQVWSSMKGRCYNKKNPRYSCYGEEGIVVGEEWRDDAGSFCRWGLANGWEKGLTIDRINTKGNYEPSNCRFLTRTENNKTRRLVIKSNRTGYCGVSHRGKRFRAMVRYEKKLRHVGTFDKAKDAAIARDYFVIEHNLDHILNFPELREIPL
jgi:hypothetical protein